MGSISRVKVHYIDLVDFFKFRISNSIFQVFGALLEGENIYSKKLPSEGFIVLAMNQKGFQKNYYPILPIK